MVSFPQRWFGVCAELEQLLFELVAGFHSELAERLAEGVVDGAGADEQLGGYFLVGGPVCRAAGDLCFLGRQLVPRLDGSFAGALTGRLELDSGAFGERFHAELHEELAGVA